MTTTSTAKNGSLDNLVGRAGYENAPFFNESPQADQRAILYIYRIKVSQGELADLDKIRGIEEVARLYHAQKCAFQDVLTQQGFDICSEAPKDYAGRIAVLTYYGTLIVLGKDRREGRHIVMSRIHTPRLNVNNRTGHLLEDLKLGKSPRLNVYQGSQVRGLAINPHGADGDELEAARLLTNCIHTQTHVYVRQA